MKPNVQAPSPGTPRLRLWIAMALVVLGLAVIAVMTWAAQDNWRENSRLGITQGIVADLSKGLPKDYGNGLVLESVAAYPQGVLMIVRSTRLSLDTAAGNPAALRQARDAEKQVMLGYCDSPDVKKVLGTGLVFARRYIDLKDQLFFEISLTAEDCAERMRRRE